MQDVVICNLAVERVRRMAREPLLLYGYSEGTVLYVICGLFESEGLIAPVSDCIKKVGEIYNESAPVGHRPAGLFGITNSALANQPVPFSSTTHRSIRSDYLRNRIAAIFVTVHTKNFHGGPSRISHASGQPSLIEPSESKSWAEQYTLKNSNVFHIAGLVHSDSVSQEPDVLKESSPTIDNELCGMFRRSSSIANSLMLLQLHACKSQNMLVRKVPWVGHPVMLSPEKADEVGMKVFQSEESSLLTDIHYSIKAFPAGSVVCSDGYEYYHYRCDGFDDMGWGCAYRSIQTISSWFAFNYNALRKVPTILQIQEALRRVDYAHSNLAVGSHTWIGCCEAQHVLSDLSNGEIESRILHAREIHELKDFFRTQVRDHICLVGSPVMVGAGDFAYTILGVSERDVLILDPHYASQAHSDPTCVGWKSIDAFFKKGWAGGFVNVCLPRYSAQKIL